MQVVAKTPRIDVRVEGKGVKAFLDEWDYYKEMKARLTPAKVLKIRRENAGLTQAGLAKKCGIAPTNIALMETGKRNIGIRSAKKLAKALDCDAGDFVV